MKTLTARTITSLRNRLAEGWVEPGEKLPTLHDLAEELGVSRTVIREAIAALRSDGVLESRHGVGTFVCAPNEAAGASLPPKDGSVFLPMAAAALPFMDLLELRMAFEVHAAGLAAARRSWAQEAHILDSARRFDDAVGKGRDLDEFDLGFHRAISEATNNRAFVEFFNVMSVKIIPRPALSPQVNPGLVTPDYIQHTMTEHAAICDAIASGNPDAARDAMQAHLSRSHRRYRAMS